MSVLVELRERKSLNTYTVLFLVEYEERKTRHLPKRMIFFIFLFCNFFEISDFFGLI